MQFFYAEEVQRLLYQSEAELLRLRELERIMQLSGLPNLLLSLRGLNRFAPRLGAGSEHTSPEKPLKTLTAGQSCSILQKPKRVNTTTKASCSGNRRP